MVSKKLNAENLKKLEIPWNMVETQESDILQDLQSGKISSIKEAIKEINELIEQRGTLSKEVDKKVEEIKTSVNNFILESNLKIEEKIDLKRKQVEIEQFKIQEKIDCWKDIAKLKQELRDYVKEASEREKRISTLKQIMD